MRWHFDYLVAPMKQNYTVFEGTSEIQRSIIARAVSGIHVS
jgi:hypothetical protein